MARIVPSDISKPALADRATRELATLAELKKRLPEDYTVFHGVHWSREYAKWTHFGEVDFVVVNRGGDVLLIEQKNWSLAERDAGLVKHYDEGEKNVNDQVRCSVNKIKEKFKWQHGKDAAQLLRDPNSRATGVGRNSAAYCAGIIRCLRRPLRDFDSLYRFKGREAPAVVSADVDPDSDKPERCAAAPPTRLRQDAGDGQA